MSRHLYSLVAGIRLITVSKSRRTDRRGAIAVFAAVLMVAVLAMVAFAVDLGYIAVARTEAQRTADATAHAAIIEFARNSDVDNAVDFAENMSSQYTAANPLLGSVASVSQHSDVQIGRYEFGSGQSELYFNDPSSFNAVQVHIRRTESQNGEVPLFFARVLGKSGQSVEASATAALIRNVSGFKIPPNGQNVPILPITISEKSWEHSLRHGDDEWAYDPITKTISSGSDGIPEAILFPTKTGSSGNLGTVNIGVSNNSASYLGNQVRNGLSASDLNYHGGSLELDSHGVLELTGNPGLSASLKDDLEAIAGLPRIIPVYRSVNGNGNNAVYKIVKFVGVRVMSVRLTGGNKSVTVQPASITFNGVIQGPSSGQSDQIYSSPRIVK